MANNYRTDIDGLRAIAVVAVILFHLGYATNGYLGVDVFFVISGYLITGIIYQKVLNNNFSIFNFYERRIRRIIPLTLTTTFVAFLFGLVFMLPDDLENLCQSVVASNFSANNILMYITSSDYWAVRNDYKPLMHTWSLGIEEQFYLFYPFLFFLLKGKRSKFILPFLILLTLISLFAFLVSEHVSAKFYFLPYRFFELSLGGISAIYFFKNPLRKHSKKANLGIGLVIALLLILFFPIFESNLTKILITTILTTAVLTLGKAQTNHIYQKILSNQLLSGIGKISFSLYMWHHIVFAFARYAFFESLTPKIAFVLSILILLLSIGSYHLIENPFRDRARWSFRKVSIILSSIFVLVVSSSFYVYSVGGVIKDIPELGIAYKDSPKTTNFFSKKNNIQRYYNEKVNAYDKPFTNSTKIKVLVLGSSFGRDFSNVLLESKFIDQLEISYFDSENALNNPTITSRIQASDFLFISELGLIDERFLSAIEDKFDFSIDRKKVFIVGTKNFGYSNGIHYNKKRAGKLDFLTYRTKMKVGMLKRNRALKETWQNKYIDLITLVADREGKVLVFTPDGKFISQDTVHLTKFGAQFFANLLEKRLRRIFHFQPQ